MKSKLGRGLPAVAALSLMFFAAAPAAAAETWTTLESAVPDECFYGVGSPSNQYPLSAACNAPAELKTNEAYVWGLTKSDNNTFFGTGQNILCLVLRGYLGATDPVLTPDYVCEFG